MPMTESTDPTSPAPGQINKAVDVPNADSGEELRLSELLILASLWMIFGFMLWFYLSAFHGAPRG